MKWRVMFYDYAAWTAVECLSEGGAWAHAELHATHFPDRIVWIEMCEWRPL